ncbi:hypothetical protein LTR40_010445, partial [Exophiala xenobiotica]
TAQPKPHVKSVEDKIQASITTSNAASTSNHPPRPGYGTRGREMVLWANYFELTGYENLLLYRHSISIAPDRNGREPGPKKRRRIVQILLEEYFNEHEADI